MPIYCETCVFAVLCPNPCSVCRPSAMAGAGTIDVTAPDTGLASCLRMARLSDSNASLFIQKHKLESLEDFVYVVERSSWEASLKELAEAPGAPRGQAGLGSFEGCL